MAAAACSHGQLEPHMFFGAVICLAGMFDPVRKLGNVNNRVQAADAAAARVFELIDTPTEEPRGAAGAAGACRRSPETIEFRDVGFAYPGSLDRLGARRASTSTVRAGQVVAIVGPNGSGKTTLVSLLLRFFEPTSGAILLDGPRTSPSTRCTSLRSQLGLVTQEAVIFSSTVRDNIAYGVASTDDEAIRRAAKPGAPG